jgi:hypothetical protein
LLAKPLPPSSPNWRVNHFRPAPLRNCSAMAEETCCYICLDVCTTALDCQCKGFGHADCVRTWKISSRGAVGCGFCRRRPVMLDSPPHGLFSSTADRARRLPGTPPLMLDPLGLFSSTAVFSSTADRARRFGHRLSPWPEDVVGSPRRSPRLIRYSQALVGATVEEATATAEAAGRAQSIEA